MRPIVSGKPAIPLTDAQRRRVDLTFWQCVAALVACGVFYWLIKGMWDMGYLRFQETTLARIVERIAG